MRARHLAWLLALILCPLAAHAHKQSDSYLTVTGTGSSTLQGQWDIALRDLDFAIGLDGDADDRITWGEIRGRREAIAKYAFEHLRLAAVSPTSRAACPTTLQQLMLDEHVDGAYAVLRFTAACPAMPQRLEIDYSLLFSFDPNHRGLLNVEAGAVSQAAVLSADSDSASFELHRANRWSQFRSFVVEGIWHIWAGYDHVLFLFTLLLPAVVVRVQGRWAARSSLRSSVVDVLQVVTAFTVAHSLTLTLAALGLVHVPSRAVESAIAFTVLLGALNLLFPVVRERRWAVALLFGLVHGLGFASVLADLGLPGSGLLTALIGFNTGVEIGQLAIVALLVPLIYLVRETALYRRVVLPAGAAAIGALAVYWMAARLFPAAIPA